MTTTALKVLEKTPEERRALLLSLSGRPSKRKQARVRELEQEEVDRALATAIQYGALKEA